MPVIKSTYVPPFIYQNDLVTIAEGRLKNFLLNIKYHRERFELSDGDFIDVDWLNYEMNDVPTLVLVHGFEGSSRSPAVIRIGKLFSKNNWRVAALNLKGCSGETNRMLMSYNSGSSDQLGAIVDKLVERQPGRPLVAIGLSLGGNIALKYSGENKDNLPKQLRGILAVCSPCNLKGSSVQLHRPRNRIYERDFLKSLRNKAHTKKRLYPHAVDWTRVEKAKSIFEFDDCFTSIVAGFADAEDYYSKCSAQKFLKGIFRPTHLISSMDDPFLSICSFPFEAATQNPRFAFEYSQFGGHLGFPGQSWLENRCFEIATQMISAVAE